MKKNRIKILFFIPGFYYGGIETLALSIIEHIDHNRFTIDILKHSNNPDNTEILNKIQSYGGKIYNVPPFRLTHLIQYIRETRIFLLKYSDYDVIHSHSLLHSLFLFYYASKLGIKKRILHSHTTHWDGGKIKQFISDCFRRATLPFATEYIACSDLTAQWGFGTNVAKKKKLYILHNGIDLSSFGYNNETRENIRKEYNLTGKHIVGHVGRLTTPKNVFFLVDIIKSLVKKDPQAMLLQIGEGPDWEPMKEYARNQDVADYILFLGKRNDVQRFYSVFDVFVLPSIWEGAPICSIEAQANGLPCILSDVITHDVDVCEQVHYVSLKESPSVWADRIISTWNRRNDSNTSIQKLQNKGYSKDGPIKLLESIYSEIDK